MSKVNMSKQETILNMLRSSLMDQKYIECI